MTHAELDGYVEELSQRVWSLERAMIELAIEQRDVKTYLREKLPRVKYNKGGNGAERKDA